MRRILLLVPIAILTLAVAGIAIAAKRDKGTASVAFAVSASADDSRTRTCTGVDGTYQLTRATYRGTISGGRYDGLAAVVRLRSTVNTTENAGLATGRLFIRDGDRLEARASLAGVVEGGTLTGILRGRDSRGEDRGYLLANFSGTLSAGSLSLEAGSGSAANAAIVFGGTGCGAKPATTRVDARGEVSALGETSIVVSTDSGTITCSLTSEQAARLARTVKVGDRVRVRCVGGRLVSFGKRR